MNQARIFFNGEGDKWHERNRKSEINYAVVDAITGLDFKPNSILEIGCGSARYLGELHRYYGCRCVGIDPSAQALAQGRKDNPALILRHDMAVTAMSAEFAHLQTHDLIVFGFCLYLLDREDVMMAVAFSDGILRKGGYIAIHDFDVKEPKKAPYKHKDGVFTYKMDYPSLWLANPEYSLVFKTTTAEGEAITIIRRTGWP